MPLHCTLLFDADHSLIDYARCWDETIDRKPFLITSENIYLGPQGAATTIKLPDNIKDWFHVQHSVPHVTLLVADGHESHELGPMIKAACQVPVWVTTENNLVHISADGQYIRISIKVGDETVAEKVLLEVRTATQMPLETKHENLLDQVPSRLWSQHKTDVGFVKSAQPVKIKVKTEARLPFQKQYPLQPHAIEGIRPIIDGLVKAGVLIKTNTKSPCNTPIFPIKKPHSKDYRLVHDLRAINAIVDSENPVVPDPHTLLSNIPPEAKWYIVIDLCSAFFSVPLHPDSQYLFAFTYGGQQFRYSRLPQGFSGSPSLFNQALMQDLQNLDVPSTILQYADDLLICSPSQAQCERDSVTVLTTLAEGGHKVNRDKLQFCQQTVEYLGRQLCGEKRCIAPSQVEAATKAPQPQTVGQMLTFLGQTGFSRSWICDYALKTAPLRAMIKAAGQTNNATSLVWTEEALGAFQMLKNDMQTAPALGNPNYTKPFHLYVIERSGYGCAVLMQDTPTGKQPLAYYSTKLDNIETGLPPCYQGLAAAAFAFQKASSLTMGHPVNLYTSHQLHALLTSPRFVLTQARRTGYEVILSAPELTILRCKTINPATKMVLPVDGTPHDCLSVTDKFMRAREDLHNQAIPADLTLFVDGSCFRDGIGNHAGYGVVQLNDQNGTFTTLQSLQINQPCSAQLAEIKALTAACQLAAGRRLNVYTDSAYAYGVCHIHANTWKQRGFLRADGTPVIHGEAISKLLEAMLLPKALAIIKCPAHQKTDTLIARGNNLADEAAKQAATGSVIAPILVAQDCAPLTTLSSLIVAQSRVPEAEKRLWLQRGAIQTSCPGSADQLWRSPHGHFVLPLSLLRHAIIWAHGTDHCSRGQILHKLRPVWWAPYLAATVDRVLSECEICAQHNVRKTFTAPIAHIPAPEGPFRHLVMDFIDMGVEQRIGRMRYVLVIVCRFSRWVEAAPCAKQDHLTVAKFLCREVFPRFGMPDTISSDNGASFVLRVFQETLKKLGIKQKFGCVYSPASQGVCERQNVFLKTKMAKIMRDSEGRVSWVDALPLALMSMRSQTNRETHLTPHEMLTGRPMPIPYLRGPIEGPPLETVTERTGRVPPPFDFDSQSYIPTGTRCHREPT